MAPIKLMQTKERLEAKWQMINAKCDAAHAALKRKIADSERRERAEILLKKIAEK